MNNTIALKYLSLGLCLGLQYIRLRCLLFWEYLEYLLFWNTFIWQCNKIFYLRFLYRYFKPVAILPSSTFYNLMEQAYSSIRSLYNYIPEFLYSSNSQLKHGLIFCCLGLLLPWPSPVYLPYCRGKACPLCPVGQVLAGGCQSDVCFYPAQETSTHTELVITKWKYSKLKFLVANSNSSNYNSSSLSNSVSRWHFVTSFSLYM